MSRPYVETFSGSHQSSIGSPYLPFISKLTFVVCPALTSTSLSCLPSVSCQTSIFCLPAGTFSSFATPLVSVTAATPRTTAPHPSIHECTSHVRLMISGLFDFFLILLFEFRLRLFVAGVRRRIRVDVVQDVVRVLQLHLARRHDAHVRNELASVLIDHGLDRLAALGVGRRDDRVREALVGADDNFFDRRLLAALLRVLVD